jgi:hypothetical protein
VQQPATTTPVIVGNNAFVIPAADVPRTGEEFRALERRIRTLREQLQDAAERRNSVASNLRSADEQARQGYVERLKVLDARIIGLETEISNSVGRLAAAPTQARLDGTTTEAPRPEQIAANAIDSAIPIVAIVSVFFLFPLAIAIARFIWKRSASPAVKAGPDRATQDRLEQLQQSMDAVAIEVERISEGQRFVTKLMSDRQIGSGAAEPVAAQQRSPVGRERG